MPISKTNNVYKITINETEFYVKYFKKRESKDNNEEVEVYLQEIDKTFKNLKEFRLYINFLTDICEELQEGE